jgi:hypothetical protein
MRRHGSLTKDEETNEAAWEAARGAGVGAAKVSAWRMFSSCEGFLRILKVQKELRVEV